MIFIWGTKKVTRNLGYVAEACPRCKAIQPFNVKRLGMAGHFYHISFAKGDLIGYVGECQECGEKFDLPQSGYPAYERSADIGLDALIAKTNPSVLSREGVAKGVSQQPRDVRGVLLKANRILEPRYGEGGKLITVRNLAILAAIVGPIAIAALLSGISKTAADGVYAMWFPVMIATPLYFKIERWWFFRSKVKPDLYKQLAALNTGADEINSCVRSMRDAGFVIGKFV
jgi:hypothetical protein